MIPFATRNRTDISGKEAKYGLQTSTKPKFEGNEVIPRSGILARSKRARTWSEGGSATAREAKQLVRALSRGES